MILMISTIQFQDKEPVCKVIPRVSRRSNSNQLPSHDPYIPRNKTVLFNCSTECNLTLPNSMTELVGPHLVLKTCFLQDGKTYECEPIRYHYLKNADKVLFLSNTIPDKSFYIVDCLVYSGGERVCHKKDSDASYANLVDTGTIARPKEPNILAQDEFICEETTSKVINCDLNPFVPFDDGLKLKESIKFSDTVLLKSGTYMIILTKNCIESWCGYSGRIMSTRRQYSYKPPGGSVYRCYYAKRQQVCKVLYTKREREVYNQRGWLSAG